MKTIKGDLIKLTYNGEFDVILHGVNCFNTQKAGIAKQMVEHFNTDSFLMEGLAREGKISKLGNIDFEKLWKEKEEYGGKFVKYIDEEEFVDFTVYVVNCYTQYNFGTDKVHLDYEALTLCLRKVNDMFKGQRVGLPLIGGGLAGGDEKRIKEIIKTELKDCNTTLVLYDK